MSSGTRRRGTVHWFDEKRGFGFITPDDGGRDVFVHYSDIKAQGWRRLTGGQQVEYDVKHESRGPKACDVVPGERPNNMPYKRG